MSAATEWINKSLIRCDAATPGPWMEQREQDGTEDGWEDSDYATGRVWGPNDPTQDYDRDDDTVAECGWGHDAEFIAAARDDLPKALAALRAVLAFAEEEWGPSTDLPSVLRPFTITARLERVIAEALGVQP